MVWQTLKKGRREHIQPSDWVVPASDIENIVLKMQPLQLPRPLPKRVVFILPEIPPQYFCIPSLVGWYDNLCQQTQAYASNLQVTYESKISVLVSE